MDKIEVKEFEKNIEKVNKSFIFGKKNERMLLDICREKYIHFMLYSSFKEQGWDVRQEVPSDLLEIRNGKKPTRASYDLAVFKNNEKIAIIEVYLGYDAGSTIVDLKAHKKLTKLDSNSFRGHISWDYHKLKRSKPKSNNIYILNYIYKGETERKDETAKQKKQRSYDEHFNSCVEICHKIIERHKKSKSDKKLGIWMVEARDDGNESRGIQKFE